MRMELKYRARRFFLYLALIPIAAIIGACFCIGAEILFDDFRSFIRGDY